MKEWKYHLEKSKDVSPFPTEKAFLGEGTAHKCPASPVVMASVSSCQTSDHPSLPPDFGSQGWRNVVQGQHSIFLIFLKPSARDLCAITDPPAISAEESVANPMNFQSALSLTHTMNHTLCQHPDTHTTIHT